jgi:catechol 2,3-dioxygenase-like lactoylglutathione lyase family enzyme
MLDHILLGCSDLDRGIDFVEKHTGIPAAFGGVHPGRGTRNALLSLGERSRDELKPRRYLEIIAPDPQQSDVPDPYGLLKLSEPRLVGWAAHPGDLNQFATRLRNADIAFDGPNPGSRKRPDGELLKWKTLNLKDNASGLLPFFIEWSADTTHPSVDAPRGCHLARFELLTPDPEKLRSAAAAMGLGVEILKSEKAQLRAAISCAGRELVLTS